MHVCAPEACSAEMVGRLIAPRFALADFVDSDVVAWPRLGTEVWVVDTSEYPLPEVYEDKTLQILLL